MYIHIDRDGEREEKRWGKERREEARWAEEKELTSASYHLVFTCSLWCSNLCTQTEIHTMQKEREKTPFGVIYAAKIDPWGWCPRQLWASWCRCRVPSSFARAACSPHHLTISSPSVLLFKAILKSMAIIYLIASRQGALKAKVEGNKWKEYLQWELGYDPVVISICLAQGVAIFGDVALLEWV